MAMHRYRQNTVFPYLQRDYEMLEQIHNSIPIDYNNIIDDNAISSDYEQQSERK